jgi:hypothetical protein
MIELLRCADEWFSLFLQSIPGLVEGIDPTGEVNVACKPLKKAPPSLRKIAGGIE